MTPTLITFEEALKIAGVSRNTLYAAVRKGRVKAKKMGRNLVFYPDDIHAYAAHIAAKKLLKSEDQP